MGLFRRHEGEDVAMACSLHCPRSSPSNSTALISSEQVPNRYGFLAQNWIIRLAEIDTHAFQYCPFPIARPFPTESYREAGTKAFPPSRLYGHKARRDT
ncbi:hypothetical protein DIPPA_00612 [Diplonema papillatum]|nr:hypothetical protein DIPPA_00612 [Diplonema papillatum]